MSTKKYFGYGVRKESPIPETVIRGSLGLFICLVLVPSSLSK